LLDCCQKPYPPTPTLFPTIAYMKASFTTCPLVLYGSPNADKHLYPIYWVDFHAYLAYKISLAPIKDIYPIRLCTLTSS
jgi:hypothetical protein